VQSAPPPHPPTPPTHPPTPSVFLKQARAALVARSLPGRGGQVGRGLWLVLAVERQGRRDPIASEAVWLPGRRL
jgi:hypothetical protein